MGAIQPRGPAGRAGIAYFHSSSIWLWLRYIGEVAPPALAGGVRSRSHIQPQVPLPVPAEYMAQPLWPRHSRYGYRERLWNRRGLPRLLRAATSAATLSDAWNTQPGEYMR